MGETILNFKNPRIILIPYSAMPNLFFPWNPYSCGEEQ